MERIAACWQRIVCEEKGLLRDLALILLVSLVTGVFFLENVDRHLQDEVSHFSTSMAQLIAAAAADFVVSDNMLSLAVLARQAAELDAIQGIEMESLDSKLLARAGEQGGRAFLWPMRGADGQVAGQVRLWFRDPALAHQKLETGFVFIVFCLLVLRLLVRVVVERLSGGSVVRAAPDAVSPSVAGSDAIGTESDKACAEDVATLRISVGNHDFLAARYTPSLINEILADYRLLAESVTALYGGEALQPLGKECLIRFAVSSEAAFQALCAGQLFLRTARYLAEQRKLAGQPSLEFKLLVSARSDAAMTWACCLASRPGRVNVAEDELVQLGLDARVLCRAEQVQVIRYGGESLRLQPVEQLAQRYQKLIGSQAEQLIRHYRDRDQTEDLLDI